MEHQELLVKNGRSKIGGTTINRITHPTASLNNLAPGHEIVVPNFQRISFNGTIHKMKYTSTKKFSCRQIDDKCFLVKRIDNAPHIDPTDSWFTFVWEKLPVKFRHLGSNWLFVNSLTIETLCPMIYQAWRQTESAKSFLAKLPRKMLQDAGYYPDFMLHYVVAVEYAKTCKLPLSAFIAEQSDIILQSSFSLK